MIKLSFISDEATQDFQQAVAFAKEYDLQGIELRSVQDKPIDEIDRDTLKEYRQLLDQNNLTVPNIAGSFYKCHCSDPQAVEENLAKLTHLCDVADIFGCDFIRGFAFFAPEQGQLPPEELVAFFEKPAQILQQRNKILLLEADPSVNTSNHSNIAALLERLNRPCFGAIFDPGNNLYDPHREPPYPVGYDAVRPYIRHIHIKDAVYDGNNQPQCVCIGQGLVGYPALLKRLLQDGYDGWLSLETHYRKNVTLTEEQMRNPQGNAFSSGGLEATAESAQALQQLLDNAKKELETIC